MRFAKHLLCPLGVVTALTGCVSTDADKPAMQPRVPKNIIMVVADGMGPAYTTAYRNFKDDPSTHNVERVVFDSIFAGNASTYPAPISGKVTDSSAAATALASGIKTVSGTVGIDVDGHPVTSVMHLAKSKGMRTGLAVTSQIVHATPASYIAHNVDRDNYDQLADSFFDQRVNQQFVADVMLGGGLKHFERKDRNVLAEFIDAGYQYVDSYNRLAAVPAGQQVIGLFAQDGLPWAMDDVRHDRLRYMTQFALKQLEAPQGFFLLVEASQVDWAGHDNDIVAAMHEMDDLANTLIFLKEYVAQHPDTLVVVTADHSTGGLTLGANGEYRFDAEWLQGFAASPEAIAKGIAQVADGRAYAEQQMGFALTDEEWQQIASTSDDEQRHHAIAAIVNVRSNTGWTTDGHTGVDVEVFAFGAGARQFVGQLDNTDIAKRLLAFVGHRAAPSEVKKPVVKVDEASNISSDASGCDFKADWRCQ